MLTPFKAAMRRGFFSFPLQVKQLCQGKRLGYQLLIGEV